MNKAKSLRRFGALILVGIGWLLSPLCWWNDLLFNLPIAVGFAKVLSVWKQSWFVPGLVTGYWLSNVVGIILMQSGALGLLPGERTTNPQRDILIGLGTSTLYTLAVVALVRTGWLRTPIEFLTGVG